MELVAMCSWASIITSVLGFREEMSQNMTRVGCCGPIQSLVCIIGHAGEGLGILRKEPAPAQPADKVFPVCFFRGRRRRREVEEEEVEEEKVEEEEVGKD